MCVFKDSLSVYVMSVSVLELLECISVRARADYIISLKLCRLLKYNRQ